MIKLGVNIDHIATLRQARRTYEPSPVWAAMAAELGGADCITVHLREDRRHIKDNDVRQLMNTVQVKINLEMAATEEMLARALEFKPHMVTLVPEGRLEITTEGGLDIVADQQRLTEVINQLRGAGILTSVFIDADQHQIDAAKAIAAEVCELHTGPYATIFHQHGRSADHPLVHRQLSRIKNAVNQIQSLGLVANGGHALNYQNVTAVAAIDGFCELHIGHAIVSRAVFIGMQNAVAEMKKCLELP